ncbi:MAG: hypothetical protein NXI32_31035 [bacterium]|nr:hypothetical protein [bacterium]
MQTLPISLSQTATILILAGVSILFFAASTLHGETVEAYQPQVGEMHSDFTLPNIVDRAPVSLAQYRGKKVLLIHFASW